MTDGELVRKTLGGRIEAYEELVRRWAGRVTALCHAKLGCAATADDVAQESFLRGFRALGSLNQAEKFGPWLCRIALHNCINWLNSRDRKTVLFSTLDPVQNPSEMWARPEPVVDTDKEEELERLRKEVAVLPAKYREVVTLYYHQKVTYQEMAQILGVSAATVNVRLTKARAVLRERLSHCRR